VSHSPRSALLLALVLPFRPSKVCTEPSNVLDKIFFIRRCPLSLPTRLLFFFMQPPTFLQYDFPRSRTIIWISTAAGDYNLNRFLPSGATSRSFLFLFA